MCMSLVYCDIFSTGRLAVIVRESICIARLVMLLVGQTVLCGARGTPKSEHSCINCCRDFLHSGVSDEKEIIKHLC